MINDCLNNEHHAEDKANAARMAARARNYTLIEGIQYKGLPNHCSSAYLRAKAKTFYKKFIQVMWLRHWSKGTIGEGH